MLRNNHVFTCLTFAVALATLLSAPALAQVVEEVQPVTDASLNSPKELLRQQIFGDTLKTASCAVIKADPRGSLKALEADLDTFMKLLIKHVKEKNEKGLQALFHRRIAVKPEAVAETLAKLDITYGKPLEFSIYRLWALNTVTGSPAGLKCDEDSMTVYPHYGYPLQFALWLQIMGQNEIGRIYATIVPADGRWNLGAFHVQQWTHIGKEAAVWTDDAIKTSHDGAKEAAYAKYDLAAKLLDGGKLFDIAAAADVAKARDAVMSREDWDKNIRAALPGYDVLYTATLFVTEGAGILVRLRIPAEISVEDVRTTCMKVTRTLLAKPWAAAMGGVRCSFNMPHEDPSKDGALGGIYVAFKDAKRGPAKKP